MNTNRLFEDQLSNKIIGCVLTVSNTPGVGFLEKVYENALAYELRKAGLTVDQQYPITIHYDGVPVGSYAADLLVEKTVLVELKAVTALDTIHRAPCINYPREPVSGSVFCSTRQSAPRDQTRAQRCVTPSTIRRADRIQRRAAELNASREAPRPAG
jgi:GxxExxY protein